VEDIITSLSNTNKETLACLIIDDPLLKPKYGCLDYKKLLELMKEHNFFTEIAFIPWNYRRSDARTAQLFAENPDYFGICIHGCNHTYNEFGGTNYQELSALSANALWRMEQHKRLIGLPYDPVMVFPQGLFSSVAMQALKDQGFLAAFNSTLRATDRSEPLASELQLLASSIYADFPLFLRRYPKDKSRFVQDIAAGLPILIVEHHGAFRSGYKTITDVVDWVNDLGKIRWTSLLSIVEHYCGHKDITDTTGKSSPLFPSRLSFRTRVALRRYFSEIRDNYIETSSILTKAYKMVRG
jgi:hypothetical protein